MSTDVVCIVRHGGLHPANPAEASKLEELNGKQVMARVSQPRNIRFHRKGFALLHAIFELADTELTFKQFRKLLVARAGYGEYVQGKDDQLVFIPQSLSWGSMDETEFQRVYQDILSVALREYGVEEWAVNRLVEFA